MKIHPQAIVSSEAKLGRDVVIGPFTIIEPDVEIGDGCDLASGVVVKNGTRLGEGNRILEGTVIGGFPQHTRMPEQLGRSSSATTIRFANTAPCIELCMPGPRRSSAIIIC